MSIICLHHGTYCTKIITDIIGSLIKSELPDSAQFNILKLLQDEQNNPERTIRLTSEAH